MRSLESLPEAINLASIGKQDKKYIQRRDDCAEFRGDKISINKFIKKNDLAIKKVPTTIRIFVVSLTFSRKLSLIKKEGLTPLI